MDFTGWPWWLIVLFYVVFIGLVSLGIRDMRKKD